jgi:hypothetical protein
MFKTAEGFELLKVVYSRRRRRVELTLYNQAVRKQISTYNNNDNNTDQAVRKYIEVMANGPDIIVKNKNEKRRILINVAKPPT